MGMQKWREDPDEELAKIFKRSELSTFWTTNISLIIEPGETLVCTWLYGFSRHFFRFQIPM